MATTEDGQPGGADEPEEGDRSAARPEENPAATGARPAATPARTGGGWTTAALRAVDYVFYVLYALLGLRFLLSLLGANPEAGFVRLVNGVTDPFYAPFEAVLARPSLDGGTLDMPVLLAILGYGVLHLIVRGLLKVIEGRGG